MPRLRRLAALAALCLLPAATADAAITTTNVTSPADLTRYSDELGTVGDEITVSGTTDGTTGDQVDIQCRQLDGAGSERQSLLLGSVAVAADGSFSGKIQDGTGQFGPCRIRATPTGMWIADYAPFTGPRVMAEERRLFRFADTRQFDFYETFTGTEAVNDFYSVASCGPCDHALIDLGSATEDPVVGDVLWFGGPAFYRGIAGGRTPLLVDGHLAFFATDTNVDPFRTLTPFPLLTSSVTRTDGGGGRIVDVEEPVRCQSDTITATSECTSTASLGIRMTRTITQDTAGTLVRVSDTYTSTDGAAHELDAIVNLDLESAETPAYAFPYTGSAAFAPRAAADALPGPSSAAALPVTVLVRDKNGSADDTLAAPRGSLTFGSGFTGGTFRSRSSPQPRFSGTVPATGSITFEIVQTIARTDAAAAALGARAEDLITPPSVTLTGPGTTTGATAAVSGVATDPRRLASLTVNGVAIPVGADGAYSGTVPVPVGPSTLTAVATDGEGNTATATAAVTRTVVLPPTPTPTPGPAKDTVKPVVSKLVATKKRVTFRLSEAAQVKVVVARRLAGRRVGTRCVRPTRANRRRKACRRETPLLTRRITGRAGANSVTFKTLKTGSYAVIVTATDAAGNTGTAARRTLAVKRPRKK